MEPLPRYDDDGSEDISYQNIWRNIAPQQVVGADCFNPEATLQPTGNKLVLELTDIEFTKMFSALYNGAEMTYPDEFLQIIVNFLKGLHCPPEMEDESGCINFLPFASFIEYSPANPYNDPDTVPEGYLMPPFIVNTDFDYPAEFGYLSTDVMVPIGALTAPDSWEDLLTLPFPTIKIHVVGEGQIELDLLQVVAGGRAIIKVGSPPNILDLIDGIIETGVILVELGQDVTSLPPESDLISAQEIPIDAPEGTDVYIVFVPAIDISTELFNYGGGLRRVGLCGLETDAIMAGVEDIRLTTTDELNFFLEKRMAGEWLPVGNWDLFNGLVTNTRDVAIRGDTIAESLYYASAEEDGWIVDGTNYSFENSPLAEYIDNKDDALSSDIVSIGIDLATAIGDAAAASAAAAAAAAAADDAALAAAAAQVTADEAVIVNNSQNTAITGINTHLDSLDVTTDDLVLSVAQHNLDIESINLRINPLDSGGAWVKVHDFTVDAQGYEPFFGDYDSFAGGFVPDVSEIVLSLEGVATYANQIEWLEVAIITALATDPEIRLGWESTYLAAFEWLGNGNVSTAWLRVPNQQFVDFPRFRVDASNGTFVVKYARYLGKGNNPFA